MMSGRKRSSTKVPAIVSAIMFSLVLEPTRAVADDGPRHSENVSKILLSSAFPPVWLKSEIRNDGATSDVSPVVEHNTVFGHHISAELAAASVTDDSLPRYDLPQGEFAQIIRAQSPDGCGCFAEGCCSAEAGHCTPEFRFTEFNIYPTFSYLGDQSATYTEFEFASNTDFGDIEMENRTILNVADLPGTITLGPANPDPGRAAGGGANRSSGFGDILSGFFFSRKGSHEDGVHFGVGPVITFPTASSSGLGSAQYSIGPGVHGSVDLDRLTAGFFLWQSWGSGVDPGQTRINQLFGKPFLMYECNDEWDLVYIPLGLSHGWKKPKGADWTIPLGGGFRRKFTCHGQKMAFQMQAFDYVARKTGDPEWELRFTIEHIFDE